MERRVFTKKRVIGATVIVAGLLFSGAVVLWPAYTNPDSRLYTSIIGFLNVQRFLGLPIQAEAGHPVLRDFEAPVLGEGTIQSNFYNVAVVPTARIKTLKVEEGDQVKQGQLLAELDDKQALIDLDTAELAVSSAKAQLQRVEAGSVNEMQAERPEHDTINLAGFEQILKDARGKVAMFKQLEKDGASSRLELVNAEIALANAQLNYDQAKVSAGMSNQGEPQSRQIALNAVNDAQNLLREKQEALKNYKVTAPADGIVDRVLVRDGEFNQNSGNTGFIIASGMWFEADMDQQSVADLKEGMDATVDLEAYTGRSLNAKVERIIPIVTFNAAGPETKTPVRPLGTGTPEWPATFKIRLRMEDAGMKLAPGMTGFTRIVRHRRALAISRAAVFSRTPGKGVVRVVDGSNRVVAARVSVGESDDQFAEITGGLVSSNWVLINNSRFLRDDDRVHIARLTPSQQAAKYTQLTASERNAVEDQLKQIDTETPQAPKAGELTLTQRNALPAQLKEAEAKAQQAQENAKVAAAQRDALQIQLNDIQAKAQQTEKYDELLVSQRDALQTRLNDIQSKAQEAQNNDELAANRTNSLEVQLKESEAKVQQAQDNAKIVASQRDALQAQLSSLQAKAEQTKKNDQLELNRTNALQAKLTETEAKAQQSQQDAKVATSQRDALQAQLSDIQAKTEQAQKNDEVTSTRTNDLQAQLHDAEAKAQQAQENAKAATNQRDALQARLKDMQAKDELAQRNGELAANQRDALQTQLKESQAKVLQAQEDAKAAGSQRDSLQAQLKDLQAKAEVAQRNGELAANQRDALQAQLKESQAKVLQAQEDVKTMGSQRDALQVQVKDLQAKAETVQENGNLAANQRDALQVQLKDLQAKAQETPRDDAIYQVQPNTENGSSEDTEESPVSTDPAAKTGVAAQDDHPSTAHLTRSAKALSESKKGRHTTRHHLAVRRGRRPLRPIEWLRRHLASE